MDVLAYSAFNQQVNLNQQIAAKTSCLSTKCSETAAQQASAVRLSAATICWVQCIEPCLLRCPFAAYSSAYACCIPDLATTTAGFKVCRCAAGTSFNYGACCLWTVPTGANFARFQLWGAGGGSGSGCCCGGSPFGSTGAYASVIIPVTAGNTYTICSGCAAVTATCSTNPNIGRLPGCPSYVTGNGLSNFCANGGQGRLGTWMAAYGGQQNCRIVSNPYSVCGPYICNNGVDFCVSSSTACTYGIIPHIAGAPYFGTTNSATVPSIVYGIRGMWPCFCMTNYGGHTQYHPPVYGFSTLSCCGFTITGTCCGYALRGAAGFLNVPSAGAAPSYATGGNNTICADPAGRAGMVCVTYC